MNTQALYNQIKAKLQDEFKVNWMPELKQAHLKVMPQAVSQQEAWSKIASFDPTMGWLQTIDAVLEVNGELLNHRQQPILAGEMINKQKQTLHIRPGLQGLLNFTYYSEEGKSEYFFTEISHQVKLKKDIEYANYRLYWAKNIDQRQPQFSVFSGFSSREG